MFKNNLASVYERHNESSIIPPLKNCFLASDFMKTLTIVRFFFEMTRAKRVPFLPLPLLFGVWGGLPQQGTE